MTAAFAHLSRRRFGQMALGLAGTLALPGRPFAQTPADTPVHGLSAFGDLKYRADYTHFDYATPDAPQGGRIILNVPSWVLNQSPDTFDTFNTFILQGNAPPRIESLYEGLMTASLDEPYALYGCLAESVAVSADGNLFTFQLRPEARFSTGAPVLASDVAFSYRALKADGHPSLAITLAEVASVEATGERSVAIRFSGRQTVLAALDALVAPIVPESFFADRPFTQGGFDAIPGSGPRRVAEVRGDRSGIAMAVETTMEGMQLYTANFLSSGVYKDGRQYGPYGALCLETQRYPDAVNHEGFPSPVLRAGETYRETTIYRFL